MSMDPATIERLAREHPERYRGGRIDRGRHRHPISDDEAQRRLLRCLEDDNPGRAAYWAGYAGTEGEK